MSHVTVLKVNKVEGKNQLRAFADVSINGEITIKGVRLMEDPKGYWLGFPQTSYESNGKPRYTAIIEVSEELKKMTRIAILKTYQEN